MVRIQYAIVSFRNGIKKTVPISSIPGFFPKNREEFDYTKKVKVWWIGNQGKEDYMLNANILLLGSKLLTFHKLQYFHKIKSVSIIYYTFY